MDHRIAGRSAADHLPSLVALYPPDVFVSGVNRSLMMNWEPLLSRVFRLGKPKKRADERTRTADLLITGVRSGVARRCKGLQIRCNYAVLTSLDCYALEEFAPRLGST